MEFEIADSELEDMAYNGNYKGRWPDSIVRTYRKRVTIIKQAKNRMDLYALRSLCLEKLKGKRQHEHSMCLNDKYRLVLEFAKRNEKEIIIIKKIEDYH
jgi:proteic killer suppression protein